MCVGGKSYCYCNTHAHGIWLWRCDIRQTTVFSSFLTWWQEVNMMRSRKKKGDLSWKWGTCKCHPAHAVCGVYGLMFALDAKRRRLQGKDRQPCQLLGVIKLKCSSILARSKAPWPWWMHFQHYTFTWDGAISPWRKAHSSTVMQLLVQLSLSCQFRGLISTEPPVDLRHRCSFFLEAPALIILFIIKCQLHRQW